MNEVIAACIGAVVSIFLFTLSIIVNRKDKDVRAKTPGVLYETRGLIASIYLTANTCKGGKQQIYST